MGCLGCFIELIITFIKFIVGVCLLIVLINTLFMLCLSVYFVSVNTWVWIMLGILSTVLTFVLLQYKLGREFIKRMTPLVVGFILATPLYLLGIAWGWIWIAFAIIAILLYIIFSLLY